MWMLLAVVKFRIRRSMWAEAYFELVERGNDEAQRYADAIGDAWVCDPPNTIN
jgi:hypothetical protein